VHKYKVGKEFTYNGDMKKFRKIMHKQGYRKKNTVLIFSSSWKKNQSRLRKNSRARINYKYSGKKPQKRNSIFYSPGRF
jgi:hypothetical protein